MSDTASNDSGFLCHTSMTKGGREQTLDRMLDMAVYRPAQACPGTASVDAISGSRNAMCTSSSLHWKPPMWVQEKIINSKVETSSCSTKTNASFTSM